MMRGAFLTIACSGLALAACATPSVQVRAIADPANKLRGGGDELAHARSMLALNSVGLALEGFREVEIEQPSNPDVYVGIAQCYSAMGRFDLESSNYEKALAYAPHDRSILTAYAGSLERQGQTARAAAVRTELALAYAPAMQAPQTGTLTIKLPPSRPAASELIAAVEFEQKLADGEPVATPPAVQMGLVRPIESYAARVDVNSKAVNLAEADSSRALESQAMTAIAVDVPLPAAPPLPSKLPIVPQAALAALPVREDHPFAAPMLITPGEGAIAAGVLSPAVAGMAPKQPSSPQFGPDPKMLAAQVIGIDPVIKPRETLATAEQSYPSSPPRLERLSVGEVALVTTHAPIWKIQTASAVRPSVTVQWLPMRSAEGRPAIQLLNAARSQGLAARTRIALQDRGWRKMRIGDYREVRLSSLVIYSSDHAPIGRRLAAQFRCKAVEVKGKSVLVVLLGRDAASRTATASRA